MERMISEEATGCSGDRGEGVALACAASGKPARDRGEKSQAPDELRDLRGDEGHGRTEHEYGNRKQRRRQQLRIVSAVQRENPQQRVQRGDQVRWRP